MGARKKQRWVRVVCVWVKTHERYRPCQDLRGFGRTDCRNRYPRCQLPAWALLSSVAEYLGLLFTSAVRSTELSEAARRDIAPE